MKILIDPGHGFSDPGAVALTGQPESKTNLNVAKFLCDGLKALGHTVIMTRTSHTQNISLEQRQAMICQCKPDLVISIHHNGSVNQTAHGAEIICQIRNLTRCYDDNSLRLATLINAEFAKLGQNIRGIIRKPNSKNNADYYGILRSAASCKIPAIITEYAFMTKADVTDVDTYTEQKAEADAILRGVKKYIGG